MARPELVFFCPVKGCDFPIVPSFNEVVAHLKTCHHKRANFRCNFDTVERQKRSSAEACMPSSWNSYRMHVRRYDAASLGSSEYDTVLNVVRSQIAHEGFMVNDDDKLSYDRVIRARNVSQMLTCSISS